MTRKSKTSIVVHPEFRIYMTSKVYAKAVAMYTQVDSEVGGLLYCNNDDKDIIVEDMVITKQKVTSADVDFDEAGIDEAILNAITNDQVIYGWIHSHHTMDSFWSGIDESTISKLITYMDSWVVSIVGNKFLDLLGRIDYISQTPFGPRVETVDNVPIYILPADYDEEILQLQEDIDKNVTKVTYAIKGKVIKSKKIGMDGGISAIDYEEYENWQSYYNYGYAYDPETDGYILEDADLGIPSTEQYDEQDEDKLILGMC